ncbi:MAG: DHH family phosphoesterase [Oscillospiraceae bacterium]|nr:DHH family phosphoesterase [Oscillospiraceae bacterium]
MKNLTRADVADYLERYDHYCILTHRRPDGDTVGSAAALCRLLRAMGKTAHVLYNPEITERYEPLFEGLTCKEPADGDKIVAVDVAEDAMLPKAFSYLRNSVDLKIDHHGSGREFAPNTLVDPESAACAEIIWDILDELGVEMDEKMAEAIYVGTATDTGCFRFANTNVHTFDVAAECAAAGANVFAWNQLLFETNSLEKLRLQGWIAENTKLFSGGTMAVCALPKAVEERIGVDEDDMGNLSSFIRSIEGVRLAGLLRENENGCKISVRAVPGWDAAAICEKFGGGGHAGAAGAFVKLPLAEAAKALEEAMLAWERS